MQSTGNNITVIVNGITICYDDFGQGEIPVIFVHGFPFDKSSWKPQMDFLQKSNRVIAYDIRGFGGSIADSEKESITLFADDLILFMDVLQINKAIVCGLSMGGYIVLNAINRYPSRFEAIILCDTQCTADSFQAREKRNRTIKQIEANGIIDFASAFIASVFCEESLNRKKDVTEKMKNIILSTSPQTIARTLTAIAQRPEMCNWLNKISVPTLILCGKEDKVIPLTQSQFLGNKIINATLFSIDAAGHLPNVEQPDKFNRILDDFILGVKKNKK